MKTLFATLLVAVAISFSNGACSSDDNAAPLVTANGGTTPQGGACGTTADCESPLTCGYAVTKAGSCGASVKGTCVALGPCSNEAVCTCPTSKAPNGVATTMCTTATYSPLPITGSTSCIPTTSAGDGGTTASGDGG